MAAVPLGIPATSAQLAVSPGTDLYTCPAGVHARITNLSFLNTTGTARTVTVHIGRNGAANADNNKIWSAAPIPIETTVPRGVICHEAIGKVLNPGDVLRAFADAATAVTPMGSVVEFS